MSTLDILKAASELFGAVSQEVDGNIQHISNEGLQDLTTNELAQATTKAQENQTIYDANEYSRARLNAYNALNQFELISDDSINGTTTHKDAILAIKAEFPKP